jgi:GntR family transcriptional regulator, transcriptional repressor for pyruvate dehydrogenase complex
MPDAQPRSLIYESVLEALKRDLLAGTLRPGDRLPTVSAMADRMGVARASVREAYRVLQNMGLLVMTQGRGTFVAALPMAGGAVLRQFQLADRETLADLFEARLVLEPAIAAFAAQRASVAEGEAILATAREQERLYRDGRDFTEPDLRFHELLLTAAHNPVVGRMVSAVNELLIESRRRTMRIPGAADKAASYHLLVAFAVRDRDPDQAKAVMEQHVRDVSRDAGASTPIVALDRSRTVRARGGRRSPGAPASAPDMKVSQ